MINEGWKGDRITTVIVLREKDEQGEYVEKRMLRITVDKFTYRVTPSVKIAIPKRVFDKAIKHEDFGVFYVMDKNHTKQIDPKTKISLEKWIDNQGIYWTLGFKESNLISGKPILKTRT